MKETYVSKNKNLIALDPKLVIRTQSSCYSPGCGFGQGLCQVNSAHQPTSEDVIFDIGHCRYGAFPP